MSSNNQRDSVASDPAKNIRVLSSQLELSPTSPLVNGLRQSTLVFKKHHTKKGKQFFPANNENVAPEADGADTVSVQDTSASSARNQRGRVGRSQKQTLLAEKPQAIPAPQKPTKPTRSHRTTVRRSVSTSDLVSATSKSTKDPKQACSVSPKKSLRAASPTSRVKAPSGRLQQTQLTGFGVRRTARQFAKDTKKQQEADVISAIRNSEESGMKVVVTEEKGRGVITTRTFFPGDFVVEYIGELISDSEARIREAEYKKDPKVGSFMFFFSHGGQRYCVDATEETDKLGRLINHSRLHPNCVVKVIPVDGVPRLALFAKTEISPGEELLYDYGDRDRASLLAHPWLKT
ncbi:unnamed protein product [Mesocestoides corti]|nr:unnamed protein product [Mesocestoides corti]